VKLRTSAQCQRDARGQRSSRRLPPKAEWIAAVGARQGDGHYRSAGAYRGAPADLTVHWGGRRNQMARSTRAACRAAASSQLAPGRRSGGVRGRREPGRDGSDLDRVGRVGRGGADGADNAGLDRRPAVRVGRRFEPGERPIPDELRVRGGAALSPRRGGWVEAFWPSGRLSSLAVWIQGSIWLPAASLGHKGWTRERKPARPRCSSCSRWHVTVS
jgi:hypothetical protein